MDPRALHRQSLRAEREGGLALRRWPRAKSPSLAMIGTGSASLRGRLLSVCLSVCPSFFLFLVPSGLLSSLTWLQQHQHFFLEEAKCSLTPKPLPTLCLLLPVAHMKALTQLNCPLLQEDFSDLLCPGGSFPGHYSLTLPLFSCGIDTPCDYLLSSVNF